MSERLDVIKHIHNQDEKVHEFDIDWLIEQVEASDKEMLDRELSHIALYNENKQLREALQRACNSLGADMEDYL